MADFPKEVTEPSGRMLVVWSVDELNALEMEWGAKPKPQSRPSAYPCEVYNGAQSRVVFGADEFDILQRAGWSTVAPVSAAAAMLESAEMTSDTGKRRGRPPKNAAEGE